ncbi:MAG: DUF962 domain-containing protein [Rhodospirillaceae bacterium]|nr:DUF962 domain-containing protein [Rhodospirillaceae bacterium]MCY4237082.1 DUF962 domain-containing protein [Rhodospirillaceae bacterium]
MSSAVTKQNKITTYAEFWPFYLKEHRKPVTRHLHYFGSSLGITTVIVAIAAQTWWLLVVALVSGYLFAWIGHFFVEKNRPATFTYPLWSLISDFRMFWRWASGRLASDFKRFNIPQ